MTKLFVSAIMILVITSSCSKNSGGVSQCNYDPCAIVAPVIESNNIQGYLSSKNITGAVKQCSGMFYIINNPGSGAAPTVCSNITVNYVGKLTTDSVFDQSSAPVTFPLSGVITGWKDGLPLLKAGGSMTLFIPPSLGYGNQDVKDRSGKVIIPANSILIFDVSLVAVN
jgi:FKBP-type peptidyl-prolyl cis-trans isomerase FkpA